VIWFEEKRDIFYLDMNLPSLAGERYIFTFIDDFSFFTWVYFFKNKKLVFKKLKDLRSFAENKCG